MSCLFIPLYMQASPASTAVVPCCSPLQARNRGRVARPYVRICMCVYIYIYIYMYTYIYIYNDIYIWCLCTCIYIYIYTHMHVYHPR